MCRNPNTLILYPGAGAANLEEVEFSSPNSCVIIIIDGTWNQAKDIFFKNSLFRIPKQVSVNGVSVLVFFCVALQTSVTLH